MRPRAPQGEAVLTWVMWALVALATVVTYSRLDPVELYHVSHGGLAGGLGRAVVLLDYPIALVAIALVLVSSGALPTSAWWLGAPAIALCAVVAWPGVVEQADLDVKAINAVPATGVVLGLALTAMAVRRAGRSLSPRLPGDPLRVLGATVVVVVSLPWIAAEAGFHLPGDVFLGEEIVEHGGDTLAAVHLGRHHGFDGALLVLSALLLSRSNLTGRAGSMLTGYLGLMLAYGAVNMVEDAWLEQVVKRGWADTAVPSATVPRAHWIWLVVVGLAAMLTAVLAVERRARGLRGRAILRA